MPCQETSDSRGKGVDGERFHEKSLNPLCPCLIDINDYCYSRVQRMIGMSGRIRRKARINTSPVMCGIV